MKSDESRRVVVVGIDGATLDILGPWADEGTLPTLKRIMEMGAWGQLQTTFPPITPSAWSSLMTGTNPAKHGIFEFFRREDGSYRPKPIQPFLRDGATLWAVLSHAGKKVGVLNVPLTYPPEPVNGFIISGLLTPLGADDFCYPRELLNELESRFGRYRLHHKLVRSRGDVEGLLREQYDILDYRSETALYLLKAYDWDFFMVHFFGPDRIQHEFWHTMDSSHPDYDPDTRKRFGNIVKDYFQQLDEKLSLILSAVVDDNTVLILMSDHGFGPAHYYLNINTWLLEQGYLHLKRQPGTALKEFLFNHGITPSSVYRMMLRTKLSRLRRSVDIGTRYKLLQALFLSYSDIDWEKTRAYSMGNHGEIYVNLRGREPQGTVSPGVEYDALIGELAEQLIEFKDEQTGERIIDKVLFKSDLYSGPHLDRAPDLTFLTKDMKYVCMGISEFSSRSVIEPVFGHTGNHRMSGVIALKGSNIKQGVKISGASILDIFPTVLYILGVPIPTYIDGKVLENAFEEQFRQTHPPTFTERPSIAYQSDQSSYDSSQEEEIKEHLRGLGYLA